MAKRRGVAGAIVALAAWAVIFAGASMASAQQYNEDLFKGMEWRLVGPFRGGRALAVTGIPGDPETFYFGAVAGGVWKTIDGGNSWTPIFDKEPVSSIGSIAVADSDHNVIYVGTGEACIRSNISFGNGVYKSVDAGKTWTDVGLKDTRQIGAVIVDPHNADIVFVAALGHAFGPNPERGIFRTTDGGKTWQKVLYKDDKTGGIDVVFDPSNSHILYAALWQAQRLPYGFISGGPGSGLYKSIDGGTTWKQLEGNGLPPDILGRIGVSVSAGNPERVYALIEAKEGGLYRSEDGGEHWALINSDDRFRQRAWYFTHVFADPQNADTVYILNTGFYRSTDAGKTFTPVPAPHGDHHGLWIDPTNPLRMINGNDGGASISADGGKTWTTQDNQPTAQFYHVITDNRFPYYIYGSQQDNSSVAIASRSDEGVIGPADWYAVGGGEAGYVAPYPPDPNIVYAGDYEGLLTRFDKRTGQEQNINPWPEVSDGEGAAHLKYRFQWTAPMVISPHDPNVIYYGAQVLLKSSDGGMSWTAISPDLTRNDKSKQEVAGGPITHDDTGTEYYDTIFTIAESPLTKGMIWVGSDDGLIHLTRDGGKTWEDVTPKQMPEWSMVSLIEASPHDAGTAYAAIDRHKLDEIRPIIYKTNDYGKTWEEITNGIPDTTYVHAVREDPVRKGLLYAGTETGVFVSFDDGGHWQPLQLNLPTTPIHDLVIHGSDLVVATHGRSFWVLDDVSPLRQMSDEVSSADVYLFKPRPAIRIRGSQYPIFGPYGKNPPAGAIIYYDLKSAPKKNEEITLEISDSKGKLVRKYSNLKQPGEQPVPQEYPGMNIDRNLLPAKAGTNRFVWDLRYEDPTKLPGAIFGDYSPHGAYVLPGTYQVKLTAEGKTLTEPVEVRLDPRVKTSVADLEKQLDLANQVNAELSEDHQAVNQIRDLRTQLSALRKRLADDTKNKPIVDATENLDKEITAVEDVLTQPKIKSSEDSLNYPLGLDGKLAGLADVVESADATPTAQSYLVQQDLAPKLDAQLSKWKEIQSKDLRDLNEMMRKSHVQVLMVSSGLPAGAGK